MKAVNAVHFVNGTDDANGLAAEHQQALVRCVTARVACRGKRLRAIGFEGTAIAEGRDHVAIGTVKRLALVSLAGCGTLGEIADLAPGKTGELTLNLGPGTYMLLCDEPGHYKDGMAAKLVVAP